MNKRHCTLIQIWAATVGVCSTPRLKRGAEVFWINLDLDLCIKQKEKLTMRTCANTVGPPLPIPLLSLPTSLQNRYFQRTLVPRQSTATGGALAGQHSVHIETKGRCHPGYLSYNNYAKNSEVVQAWHTHTKIHGEISTVLLPLCERYFLSLAYRQAWQQWAGLLSQLLKKEKEKKNRAWGMSKPRPFVFPTNI